MSDLGLAVTVDYYAAAIVVALALAVILIIKLSIYLSTVTRCTACTSLDHRILL